MGAIWRTSCPCLRGRLQGKKCAVDGAGCYGPKKKTKKKTKKSTIKCVSWSRSRRCCLLNRVVMFRTSEPYTLEDYCLLFIIDRSQSINYFFWDFDFYRFPISIDNNQRIKSIISHNFWYRFLSINYAEPANSTRILTTPGYIADIAELSDSSMRNNLIWSTFFTNRNETFSLIQS